MSNICPLCPFKACPNSKGATRSDGLRRHVQNVHKVPTLDYVDAAGSTVELLKPTMVVKKRSTGRYGSGYCLACGCYINFMMNYSNDDRLAILKQHQCKPKQARGPRATKAAPKVAAAPKEAVAAAPAPVASVCIVDRLKKFKALTSLDLDGKVKARLRKVERSQEPPSEDEGYENSDGEMVYDDEPKVHKIEVYDEIDDIIAPLLICYSKTIPQREAQSITIAGKNNEIMQLEDKLEMAKNESAREIRDLKERLMTLSRQVSEEATRRHAAEARLKLLQPAAPAPAPDTIQHLDGNSPVQWILPYQG